MRRLFPFSLFLLLSWSLAVTANSVSIEDDLFLGVWSPMQTRWESKVPVCVEADTVQSPYRVVAAGRNPNTFALTNNIADQVRYNVFWHTGKHYKRRDELSPSVPSKRAYPNNGDCRSRPTGYIQVSLNRQDIDSAIPGVYQDTLVLMLSPL